MELVDWLRAQLDEDEQWALAAKSVHWQWVYNETDEVVTPDPVLHGHLTARDRYGDEVTRNMDLCSIEQEQTNVGELPVAWPVRYAEEVDSAAAGHIVRWDPARVMAEVAAKRQILDLCAPSGYREDGEAYYVGGYGEAYLDTVRLLALPYSDRPDYQPDWAPSAT
jgi:hypothetical protein